MIYKQLSTTVLIVTSFLASNLLAIEEKPKRALKTNMRVVYNTTEKSVDSLSDILTEGSFYGRIRSNNFYFSWEEGNDKQDIHLISGLGASLIYKSADYHTLNFTLGMYGTHAFFKEKNDPVFGLKAGKDTLSRFDFLNTGSKSMGVVAQAYVNFGDIDTLKVRVGRQLVESFYTKSNDTKMIPNTFDAVVLDTKIIDDTSIKLGYLAYQKLRDHTQSHSVLLRGDANSSTSVRPDYSENDDSAMHRGLTYTRLVKAGVNTEAPLIIGDVRNRSIKNLRLDGSFYAVPELVSQVMAEANYKIKFSKFSITPGIRYIKQFDNGAGAIGGAALFGQLAGESGESHGYKNASSLDSQMLGLRLVTKYENYFFSIAYTGISDEADLVTPWRGFPTSGYTRSMGRYNWFANTKSYRIRLLRNYNKTGVFKDLFTEFSVLYSDADENKYVNLGDTNLKYADQIYYYAGFIQNIPQYTNMQLRLRLGYNDTDLDKADNLDARFELNYLF